MRKEDKMFVISRIIKRNAKVAGHEVLRQFVAGNKIQDKYEMLYWTDFVSGAMYFDSAEEAENAISSSTGFVGTCDRAGSMIIPLKGEEAIEINEILLKDCVKIPIERFAAENKSLRIEKIKKLLRDTEKERFRLKKKLLVENQ